MNGKKARAIRKSIYGDTALRQTTYKVDKNTRSIYADTPRQEYQMAKGRKACLPIMGKARLVAKRTKVSKKSLYAIKGAFGKINRLAGVQLDMKVIRRSER